MHTKATARPGSRAVRVRQGVLAENGAGTLAGGWGDEGMPGLSGKSPRGHQTALALGPEARGVRHALMTAHQVCRSRGLRAHTPNPSPDAPLQRIKMLV